MLVSEDNFDSLVLQSATPVIVEFSAPWCGPCKQMEPILLELAQAWAGKVSLAKANVDECVNLVMQFWVLSVPTIILFKNGGERLRLTGFQPRARLVEKLTAQLKPD